MLTASQVESSLKNSLEHGGAGFQLYLVSGAIIEGTQFEMLEGGRIGVVRPDTLGVVVALKAVIAVGMRQKT